MNWFRLAALMCCFSFFEVALAENKLYVFVPTDVRANVLQDRLTKICGHLNITVFGRAKDFQKEIGKAPPDAFISLMTVINKNKSYTALARGVKAGADEEEYVLVSLDEPVDITKIDKMKIGVVDILGRKPMKKFVSELFNKEVKIKRVTKQEDLLPLLSFGAVKAIFISQSLYENIKSKSKLNLVPTSVNIKLGLVSVALGSDPDAKEQFENCISKFDQSLNGTLGVDQWKLL
jgi:hypothetical protein